MRISELFQADKAVFSFEFFPPKTDKGHGDLLATIDELRALSPDFVSVTYGAGGSTRDRTIELVSHIKNKLGLEAMAHLTCVGAGRDELRAVLDRLTTSGIENVIALRGDPPSGETGFVPHRDGLRYASDLVTLIRSENRPFCIAAACYPEGHTEAASAESDFEHFIDKMQAGASVAMTQLFFDNDCYFRFAEKARNAGLTSPIVAGIMPVTNVAQIERFTKMCGATIPSKLWQDLDRHRDDPEAVVKIGIEHSVAQCRDLLAKGAPGVHFYTLNRSRSTREILRELRAD